MAGYTFTPEKLLQMNVLGCDESFAEAYVQWFEYQWNHIRASGVNVGSGQVRLEFGMSPNDDIDCALSELEAFLPFVTRFFDDQFPELGAVKCFNIDRVAPETGLFFLYISEPHFFIVKHEIGGTSAVIDETFSEARACAAYVATHLPRRL